MLSLVAFVLSLATGSLVLGTPPPELHSLQDICQDVQKIQEDEGLFDQYYQCMVGVGPCTKDTKRLKDVIQEALERNCERCSASQRRSAVDLLKLAMECRPAQFLELEKMFDPRGTFMDKYKRRRGQGDGWCGNLGGNLGGNLVGNLGGGHCAEDAPVPKQVHMKLTGH